MLNIFRKQKKENYQPKRVPAENTIAMDENNLTNEPRACIETPVNNPAEIFSNHILRYIGSTVTIFVSAGGKSGLGFTGVLLSSDNWYIRLLVQIGPPPACSLFHSCFDHYCTASNPQRRMNHFIHRFGMPITQLGAIACIPTNRIVGFVHNSL